MHAWCRRARFPHVVNLIIAVGSSSFARYRHKSAGIRNECTSVLAYYSLGSYCSWLTARTSATETNSFVGGNRTVMGPRHKSAHFTGANLRAPTLTPPLTPLQGRPWRKERARAASWSAARQSTIPAFPWRTPRQLRRPLPPSESTSISARTTSSAMPLAHSEPIEPHHHVSATSKIRVSGPQCYLLSKTTFTTFDRSTLQPYRFRRQAPSSRTTSTHRYLSSPAHTSVQTTIGQTILRFDDVSSDILIYRVFCNRNLSLKNIKSYGFDMDYTLAVYNVCGLPWSGLTDSLQSPAIDILTYDLACQRLVALGWLLYMILFHAPYQSAEKNILLKLDYSSLTSHSLCAAFSSTKHTAISSRSPLRLICL